MAKIAKEICDQKIEWLGKKNADIIEWLKSNKE